MKTMHNLQSIMHNWLRRSWRIVLLLAIFNVQWSMFNELQAKQTQDALYVYRNDGGFDAFFFGDIERMAYSNIDTLGVAHDDFVVQEIYANGKLTRIPISAIDSISFVTPENAYSEDVAYTTEADIWNYVISSVDHYTFVLSPNTPAAMVPKVGDKLANTEATPHLPNGLFAQVTNVSKQANGITVQCQAADIEDLFDDYTFKFDNSSYLQDAANARKNAGEEWENYGDDIYTKGIDFNKDFKTFVNSFGAGKNWGVGWDGKGSVKLVVKPNIHVTYFNRYRKALWGLRKYTVEKGTIDAYVKTDFDMDIKGASISLSKDIELLSVGGFIGTSPFWFHSELGLSGTVKISNLDWKQSFYDETKAHVDYSYDELQESVYNAGQSRTPGLIIHEKRIENVIHDSKEWLIMGEASVLGGFYVKAGISVFNENLADLSLRFDVGGRAKAEFEIDMNAPNELPEVLDSDPTSQYDGMNVDGVMRANLFASGQIDIGIGPKGKWSVGKSIQLYDEDIKWDKATWVWDYVPKFSNVKAYIDRTINMVELSAGVDRNLWSSVPVGFAVYDYWTDKLVSVDWYKDAYKNQKDFENYYVHVFDLEPSKYIAYPIVEKFGWKMLANPTTTFDLEGASLKVSPDPLTFDSNGGDNYLEVTTSQPYYDAETKAQWVKITKYSDFSIKVTAEANESSNAREDSIIVYALDNNKQRVAKKTVKITQKGKLLYYPGNFYGSYWYSKKDQESGKKAVLVLKGRSFYSSAPVYFYSSLGGGEQEGTFEVLTYEAGPDGCRGTIKEPNGNVASFSYTSWFSELGGGVMHYMTYNGIDLVRWDQVDM